MNRFVQSLCDHTKDVDWELLVSDVGDPETPPYRVAEGHPDAERIRVYREWPRRGPAAGFNKLAAAAKGEWLCWLNDDVEVLPRWASAMIEALDGWEEVGLGAFYYWTPQRKEFFVQQHAGMLYANFGCMRTELFRRVGGFDVACWKYGMDNTISFRVLHRGLAIAAVEGARLLHHKSDEEYQPGDEEKQRAALAHLEKAYGPHYDTYRKVQSKFNPKRMILDITVEEARCPA